MRVVHWNTHHGGVPVDAAGNDKPINVQAITDWLIQFEPDYISLNEIEQNTSYAHMDQVEHHRLALQEAQGIPWYAYFCQMNGGAQSQGIGIALLSNNALLLPERKKLNPNRPGLYCKTKFGSMFTLHADPDSNKARCTQLSQMLCWIGDKTPLIVCGDFNAHVSDVEMAPWSVWYKDAGLVGNRPTHNKNRIDFIWYRGLTLVSCEVPDTSVNGIWPSDHNPIIAVFK